ncbi:MAG: Gfo/Idh/MocA family protein, partial [Phycisphaerales bacterium]
TQSVYADPAVDAVVITTRHDAHAAMVCDALRAGKHVFVEKPLALTAAQVDEIESVHAAASAGGRAPILMVGFNRRFAPQVRKVHSLLRGVVGPKSFVMTVNAGAIPAEHWTQDRATGGGRIIGEGCHFIDLLRHLAGAPITGLSAVSMESSQRDTVTMSMSFTDGSVGAVHYFANGPKSFPKERLEVFAAGGVLQLDNFRKLRSFGWPGFRAMNLWRQDKGQRDCARAFVDAVAGRSPTPIPVDEVFEVARASIRAALGQVGGADRRACHLEDLVHGNRRRGAAGNRLDEGARAVALARVLAPEVHGAEPGPSDAAQLAEGVELQLAAGGDDL